MKKLVAIFLCVVPMTLNAIPGGDTKGVVSAVRVLNLNNRGNTFRVYFSSTEHDSWNCISNQGYVTVREDNPYVSSSTFMMLYTLAVTAKSKNLIIVLNSQSTDPCNNVNAGWIE